LFIENIEKFSRSCKKSHSSFQPTAISWIVRGPSKGHTRRSYVTVARCTATKVGCCGHFLLHTSPGTANAPARGILGKRKQLALKEIISSLWSDTNKVDCLLRAIWLSRWVAQIMLVFSFAGLDRKGVLKERQQPFSQLYKLEIPHNQPTWVCLRSM
jgi:hypothetical protein